MVPNSRTPVRGVPIGNDGDALRAVWQVQAGLLQAQTQVFQRVRNRARSIIHCGNLPGRDASDRWTQVILPYPFCVGRRAGYGTRQVLELATSA